MTALDVNQAKRALAWRLGQWGVAFDIDGKAGSFIDDLVALGWQMAPERESRPQPPKVGEQCPTCSRTMHAPDPACAEPTWRPSAPSADRAAHLARLRAIRDTTLTALCIHHVLPANCAECRHAPEPSSAPDVAPSEPAVDHAAAPPARGEQDVQQRAGEPDDRPETACAADGCYRPTRDGICDRCREKAAADDVDAGNAELIAQLKANQVERAHTRPAPDPGPPRYFTDADINHDRVHAAQARAAEQRREAERSNA